MIPRIFVLCTLISPENITLFPETEPVEELHIINITYWTLYNFNLPLAY